MDIADTETKDGVRRGCAVFDIGRALVDPDLMQPVIEGMIRKMFCDFPEQASHP